MNQHKKAGGVIERIFGEKGKYRDVSPQEFARKLVQRSVQESREREQVNPNRAKEGKQ